MTAGSSGLAIAASAWFCLLAALLLTAGCSEAGATNVGGGSPDAGAIAIERMACGSCHRIPGIPNATGLVGPSLGHFARRRMIAGVVRNDRAQLVRYLLGPQTMVPGNAMPDQHLTARQARDVTAYLMTLR